MELYLYKLIFCFYIIILYYTLAYKYYSQSDLIYINFLGEEMRERGRQGGEERDAPVYQYTPQRLVVWYIPPPFVSHVMRTMCSARD